jgi:hypothetical protein
MSSKDLKIRLDSQFWRMNCQIFSWLLSSWRQREERDIGGNPELLRPMPAGLIEDENGVRARFDLGGDLVEMKLHGFAVAGRKHEGGTGPALGADRPEQIGRLGALVVYGTRARARAGPAVGQLVLLPDAHLVLKPHFY